MRCIAVRRIITRASCSGGQNSWTSQTVSIQINSLLLEAPQWRGLLFITTINRLLCSVDRFSAKPDIT